jgi:hypothetical protein
MQQITKFTPSWLIDSVNQTAVQGCTSINERKLNQEDSDGSKLVIKAI